MPLTLIACGGKILLYECVADPEQLQVEAKVSSAMQAFETEAERADDHVAQTMDGLISAARQHLIRQEQAEQDGGVAPCPVMSCNCFHACR